MHALMHDPDARLFAQVMRGIASAFEQQAAPEADRPQTEGLGLQEWGRRFLPDHFSRPPSKLHLWLCSELDALRNVRGRKINLLGPRGAAKSTLGTLTYPLRCALEGSEPLIWIISKTESQACKHLENIKRELAHNELLARAYPDAAGKGPRWTRREVTLRNGVGIEAYGTGNEIRGIRKGAARPSLIIGDDIQSDDVMTSANAREKDWEWFRGTLLKSGNKRTNILHMATALHREAIGVGLASAPGWRSRTFQAILKWPDNMGLWARWEDIYRDVVDPEHDRKAAEFYSSHRDAMHAGSEVLWPEEEDLLTLMTMRAEEGHGPFEREKQCRPISPESAEWPEAYFDDVTFDEWPSSMHVRVISLDPSKGKDSRRGDYSAFVMLHVGTDGLLYVDANLARRPTPQIVQDGADLYAAFKPQGLGVEANAFQELLGGLFEAEFHRRQMHGAACYLIQNSLNKQVRIRTLGPLLAKRKLRFKRGSPGAALLVAQLKDFPDPHSHDDGPDALEMAIRLASDLLQGSE